MALRELQQHLQLYIYGKHSAIAAAITDAPPLPTLQRLDIYRNGYKLRLIEAMDEIYPLLHQLLGDEVFSALSEAFIDTTPSVHRSIRWYGSELADFLAAYSPYSEQPVLAEIAHFEWTLADVFDAADHEPITRSALSKVSPTAWGALQFKFHPSMRRLALSWNAPAIWAALSRDKSPPPPHRSVHPMQWLLWRQHMQNYFRSLEPIESTALDAAAAGESFGDICAALALHVPEEEIPLRAATFVATWIDNGMVTDACRQEST